MTGRTLALGDVHGCSAALDSVLQAARLQPEDTVVTLGDYVDRGPDSAGVINRLIELDRQCRLIPLVGNHECMFLHGLHIFAKDPAAFHKPWDFHELGLWLDHGGLETIYSYGGLESFPPEHFNFLNQLVPFYESEKHIFVHANYDPDLAIPGQPEEMQFWTSLREFTPGPHRSQKITILGHTAQKDGEILDLGYLQCIDTYCYGGGWLTLYDVDSGDSWQANINGELRVSSSVSESPE